MRHSTALALLLFATSAAFAQDVHKCRATDGSVIYQDEPCAEGAELEAPVLDSVSPGFDATASDATTSKAPVIATPHAEITLDDAPPSRGSMPPLFRCVRYDGQESEITTRPEPKRYFVPAWAVVSEMGGTRARRANTRGQRASEPSNGRPEVPTGYVWVEDRCDRIDSAEACEYWKHESAEADRLGRIAFDAEREKLEAREVEYRANFENWCR